MVTPVSMHILKFAAHPYYPISMTELNAISIMLQAQLGPTLIKTYPEILCSLATDTHKSLPSFTKPYNVASSKTPDITSFLKIK